MDIHVDPDRLQDRFKKFNQIGATDRGGVNRPSLSDANKAARDQLGSWFRDVNLDVTIDAMGNLFGRRAGSDTSNAPVLLGSHVDSQYNGGRYDGVVGVLGALEVIETLNDNDVQTARPIKIVAWSNEEGVRFQPDMLGSGVFADKFDLEYAYDREDKQGLRFGDELERIGYKGDEPCEPRDLHCYFELHVEQGPYLATEDISVGVVEGVYGFSWLDVSFTGSADHAGPTPMHMRNDALVATSDVIQAVRRLTATGGPDLVGTVGRVDVDPNSINVIPEHVDFTLDFRSYDNTLVEAAVAQARKEIQWAGAREDIEWDVEEIMRVDAEPFDDNCISTVEAAADAIEGEYMRMVSGAGHDANYLNDICPTGMIFVPSEDGVSHTEDEYTDWDDVVRGADVLLQSTISMSTES